MKKTRYKQSPKKKTMCKQSPQDPEAGRQKLAKLCKMPNSQRRTSLTMKQEQHQQQRRVRRRMLLDECADDVRTEH